MKKTFCDVCEEEIVSGSIYWWGGGVMPVFGLVQKIAVRIFCLHENWDSGNRINPRARMGDIEYTCLKCEKKIYRRPHSPPISKAKGGTAHP